MTGDDPEAREWATRKIRGRHLRERLALLLADGRISSEEAADMVTRIDAGEHDPVVRRRINQLMRETATSDEVDT